MTVSNNKISIKTLTFGNPPWQTNPALIGDEAVQYHLMWVNCDEYHTGNVSNPGNNWVAALFRAVATLWRWKQEEVAMLMRETR